MEEQKKIDHEQLTLNAIQSMEEAAREKGDELKGFYVANLQEALNQQYSQFGMKGPFKNPHYVTLLMKNKIYVNEDITKVATFRVNENFKLYTEIIEKYFNGYRVGDDRTIYPTDETPTIKFSVFLSMLRSKETEIPQEMKWIFEGEDTYFFDGSEDVPRIAYLSHGRSGNTFFRKYFESITKTPAGKDVHLRFLQGFQIQLVGLKGQGVVDDRVWIVGSHSPHSMPEGKDFTGNRGLMIVRNPVDTMVSFFNFRHTHTHSHALKNEFTKEVPEYWDKFVKYMINDWALYYRYWIKRSEQEGFPIHIMRYEDLVLEPKKVLTDAFRFSLSLSSLEGTVIEQRINYALDQGKSASVAYKPRSGGVFGKNDKYYTPEQMEHIKKVAGDLLYYFGYTKQEDNPTSFFQFEEQNEELQARFYEFRKMNEANIEKLALEGMDSFKYRLKMPHDDVDCVNTLENPGHCLSFIPDIID